MNPYTTGPVVFKHSSGLMRPLRCCHAVGFCLLTCQEKRVRNGIIRSGRGDKSCPLLVRRYLLWFSFLDRVLCYRLPSILVTFSVLYCKLEQVVPTKSSLLPWQSKQRVLGASVDVKLLVRYMML